MILVLQAFLICMTALAVNSRSNNKNLVAVVQLFRHGQRTPVGFYTNDPYANKSFWGDLDLGQLTNEGKRQHYALGQYTRFRYFDWLPTKYNKDVFYAQTTDVDRTHMSGQANINGLFPARRDQAWRLFSDWQPIPLHPADASVFSTLASDCTAYLLEWATVLATAYVDLDTQYTELLDFLTEKTGDNITTVLSTSTVFDSLRSENDVGLRLPKWASEVYPQPLYDVNGWLFESFSHNTKLQRLGTGLFLQTVLDYFNEMIADPTSNPKYQMYSGHDSNIAQTLNTFGAFNPPYPPAWASTIYIELRQNSTDDYYINVSSKNGNKVKQVSIRGCALDCPIDEAKELLNDVLIDAFTRNVECSNVSTDLKNTIGEEKYQAAMKIIQELNQRYNS